MKICSITSIWNSAIWLEYQLQDMYKFSDSIVIMEGNWTGDYEGWAGDTSPDGSADIVRNFPDPENKIHFYQIGGGHHVFPARQYLCSKIEPCDWVWVRDVDEFYSNDSTEYILSSLPMWEAAGITVIIPNAWEFYYDFFHHTVMRRHKRIYKYEPGVSSYWFHEYKKGKGGLEPSDKNVRIFHYSYVPPDAMRIKGAMSMDVTVERYNYWYNNIYRKYNGHNLEELYALNSGGIHVFGGEELDYYDGKHPEILDTHPLNHKLWTGTEFVDVK